MFCDSVRVDDTIYINFVFLALIMVVGVVNILKFSAKSNFMCLVIAMLAGGIYACMIFGTFYISIDYNIWWALMLISIPLIFLSRSISHIVAFALYSTVSIILADTIYWWKELQYCDINVVNSLNILTLAICAGLSIYAIRLCIRRIVRSEVANDYKIQ